MLIRLWVITILIFGLATGSAYAQVGNEYLDNPPLFSSGPTCQSAL